MLLTSMSKLLRSVAPLRRRLPLKRHIQQGFADSVSEANEPSKGLVFVVTSTGEMDLSMTA